MPDVTRARSNRGAPGLPACNACGATPAPFGYFANGHAPRNYCGAHRADGDAWLAEIKQQRLDRLEAL